MKRSPLFFLLLALAGGWLPRCAAHQAGVSYVIVESKEGKLTGQWKAAVRDLEMVIDLDGNGDGKIVWGELRSQWSAVEQYFLEHLKARGGGQVLHLQSGNPEVEELNGEMYVVVPFTAVSPSSTAIEINYSAFFECDAGHRGVLQATTKTGSHLSTLSPGHPTESFELSSNTFGFRKFVEDGIWHIWTGADHILFLLSLLLPSVLRRDGNGWRPAARFAEVLRDIARTVTAFTVAHSITLALASLRYVVIPSQWIEIAIAVSVVFAAMNNVYPMISENRWVAAFGFGLIHGFGFAGVLTDLNISGALLAKTLVGFNLGVEIGQLAIVAGFLPIAFLLRKSNGYRRVGLQFASSMIALVAVIWICERLFGFRALPI